MTQWFLGVGPFVSTSCPCCGAPDTETRNARFCPRAGVQVRGALHLHTIWPRSLDVLAQISWMYGPDVWM